MFTFKKAHPKTYATKDITNIFGFVLVNRSDIVNISELADLRNVRAATIVGRAQSLNPEKTLLELDILVIFFIYRLFINFGLTPTELDAALDKLFKELKFPRERSVKFVARIGEYSEINDYKQLALKFLNSISYDSVELVLKAVDIFSVQLEEIEQRLRANLLNELDAIQ